MNKAASAAGELALGAARVNRIAFGAMRLIGPNAWGDAPDRHTAQRVLRRALELGVNLIDTAHSYGPETDERLIAEALFPYPADLVLATKSGFARGPNGEWTPDCHPRTLRAECERSLELLRLETIEVFQLHAVDPQVPIEESVGTLADLQREGKIRSIGVSNVTAEELARARTIATVVSVQNRYSVIGGGDTAVLEACEEAGIPFLPWFPLGGGSDERAQALDEIARARSVSPQQVAIAWLLARSPVMLPIPGTTSLVHLEENIEAAELRLDHGEMALLSSGISR